jgi:hypothetical protein
MLFTSSTDLINRICFKIFRLIPFLNELRVNYFINYIKRLPLTGQLQILV